MSQKLLPSFEKIFGFKTKLNGSIEIFSEDLILIDNNYNTHNDGNNSHLITHGRW